MLSKRFFVHYIELAIKCRFYFSYVVGFDAVFCCVYSIHFMIKTKPNVKTIVGYKSGGLTDNNINL